MFSSDNSKPQRISLNGGSSARVFPASSDGNHCFPRGLHHDSIPFYHTEINPFVNCFRIFQPFIQQAACSASRSTWDASRRSVSTRASA